jgi:hypothetical protein
VKGFCSRNKENKMLNLKRCLSEEDRRIIKDCETVINECEANRAEHAAQALPLVKIIGDRLKLAKATLGSDFAPWVTKTFGRKHEWRSSHMRVATRWEDVELARAWAKQAGSKLATVYSVDGLLKLLRAWDEAMGRASPKKKRAAAKCARVDAVNSEESVNTDLSTHEEIADLKRCPRERHQESLAFCNPLTEEARENAMRLLRRLVSGDAEAEGELRAIVCQNCWLLVGLQEILLYENSGGPENQPASAPEIPNKAPKQIDHSSPQRRLVAVKRVRRLKWGPDAPPSLVTRKRK